MGQQNRLNPYSFENSRGNIKNALPFVLNASTPTLAMGITSDVWDVGGTLVWQDTAQRIEIVSSSANDTIAGSGARQVLVRGLDGDFNLQNETVDMDGLTPVFTTNLYRRHFRTEATSSGTQGTSTTSSLAGTIDVSWETSGDPAGTIPPLINGVSESSTRSTHFTVPTGFTVEIESVTVFVETLKQVSMFIMNRTQGDVIAAPFGVVSTGPRITNFTGNVTKSFPTPISFSEKNDVWAVITATANNTDVDVIMNAVLLINRS